MQQTALQAHSAGIDPRVAFAARPPSPGWQRVAPADAPENFLWVWFKPPHVPHGLVVRIPDEVYATQPQLAAQWTLRKLLLTAGVDPACAASWQFRGAMYDALNGTSPFLDAAIPAPVAGMDPHIMVAIHPPMSVPPQMLMMAPPQIPLAAPPRAPVMMSSAQPGAAPPAAVAAAASQAASLDAGSSLAEVFKNMEADWAAALEIERDLVRLRKQLVDMMGRLKNLNRDLTPPERIHASNQDKKDWIDARRWLRDSSSKCWRCIKEHDIGDTSAAGQRKWFEETYQQFVLPRVPFDGLQQAQRHFEGHRKLVQTLHNNMSNAHALAAIDGERRAQAVLSRIATKIRDATNRKNFLGVMLDS